MHNASLGRTRATPTQEAATLVASSRKVTVRAHHTARTSAKATRSSPEFREDVGLSRDTSSPWGQRRPTAAQNVWKVPVRTSPITAVRKQLRRWRTEGMGTEICPRLLRGGNVIGEGHGDKPEVFPLFRTLLTRGCCHHNTRPPTHTPPETQLCPTPHASNGQHDTRRKRGGAEPWESTGPASTPGSGRHAPMCLEQKGKKALGKAKNGNPLLVERPSHRPPHTDSIPQKAHGEPLLGQGQRGGGIGRQPVPREVKAGPGKRAAALWLGLQTSPITPSKG